MNLLTSLFLVLAGVALVSADQYTISAQITFYGYPDNDPPSDQIAYTCNGRTGASGSGSYDDPVTVAVAPDDISPCTMMYLPYLKKYGIAGDTCAQCIEDFYNGEHHVDVWTGGNWDGGDNQIDCEDGLTPDPGQQVIINPPSDWDVDTRPLFDGDCHYNTY